jgi:pimeloyl-ACP methyl ester carboxylesterase
VRLPTHSIVAALAVLFALHHAGDQAAAQTAAHTFRIFIRGVEAGSQEVTVLESPAGWTLRGSGRLGTPINLSIDYWEIRYDREWKPLELTIDLTENTNQWNVRTIFSGTNASSDIQQGGRSQRQSHTVVTDTIVLPNLIFGAYEALAARLAAQPAPGTQLEAFIVPQNTVAVTVKSVTDETIQVPGRVIAAKRWLLNFGSPPGVLELEVWTDGSRLMRIDIPSQLLSVLRDDVSSVSARVMTLGRSNDEQVSIPANGFSLAATISRPAASTPDARPVRLPAVILVSGANAPTDRDEIVSGVPIFAQLATALADAGFLVVRYDERGTGQSGGRQDSATHEDFAVDARAVVTYLTKRKDVDPRQISMIGYSEGGWIAMMVAARERRVATLALIATPAISGSDLVLEQQRRLLEHSTASAAAQQAAIEQQKQILQAVITGKGWDTLPPQLKRRVDTPLYRSFLTFDPSQVLNKVRQPLLVVQPTLDREVPAHHGEQLAQLARSRLRAGSTEFVQLAGVNHLLTRAATGAVSEYGTLAERNISPSGVLEISSWLKRALSPPAK